LLRVLQERNVVRAGGEPAAADFAIICATHHRLSALVEAGAFRQDLYYRLNGLTIQLPPLRERNDVIALAQALAARESSTGTFAISPEALQVFAQHPWPGNIRQMQSVIRAAVAMMDDGDKLERRHLPEDFLAQIEPEPVSNRVPAHGASTESLEQIELHAIQDTVRQNSGNISAAARQLGVSRTTLYRKMKELRPAR
jgi:sigma-54 dependent transcriptional regulator, acetoin dehydrogenase operon transcriptional activator AcoR